MSEPSAPMVHGEFRARMTPASSPPPVPPLPPPGAGIDLLRDTVEVQARTIRYLLANYEALLRKVERHKNGEPEWELTVGTSVTVAVGGTIAKGFWTQPNSPDPGSVFYSDGTMTNTTGSSMTIYPVIVTEVAEA